MSNVYNFDMMYVFPMLSNRRLKENSECPNIKMHILLHTWKNEKMGNQIIKWKEKHWRIKFDMAMWIN